MFLRFLSQFRVYGLLLAGLILFQAGCASYGLPRPSEKVYRGVTFAQPGGQPLKMDLYVPKSQRPVPVVIWIFGGSWKIGSRAFHVNLRNLTRHGIAVAAIDYRLSGVAKYPAQLDDCESAVEFLRENGSQYGIDPDLIGVSGESAGGHLAALTGAVEGRSKVRAVCALYPPTELVEMIEMYNKNYQPTDMERLLGGLLKDKRALAIEASPVHRVNSDSPPFLLIHGAEDSLVPLGQSEKLAFRLRQLGISVRLIIVPGKGHWFQLTDAQLAEVAAFFKENFARVR